VGRSVFQVHGSNCSSSPGTPPAAASSRAADGRRGARGRARGGPPLDEGATEVGQAFAELVKEQARANVEAFRALAGAFDWNRAARIQADLLRASFARSAEFTRRYLEVVQAVTASAVSATREQARKAG
jgi:hypothetical protein